MKTVRKSSANQLARECIYTALLQLMDQKPYAEITVTDIAKRAGVSRMTYYRNYRSKDDILIQHIDEMLCSVEDQLTAASVHQNEFWVVFFRYFRQNRLTAAVLQAELVEPLFQCLLRHANYIFQELFLVDISDYHNALLAHCQIGALFGVLRYLLENELGVSDEQAAAFQVEVSVVLRGLAHGE